MRFLKSACRIIAASALIALIFFCLYASFRAYGFQMFKAGVVYCQQQQVSFPPQGVIEAINFAEQANTGNQ